MQQYLQGNSKRSRLIQNVWNYLRFERVKGGIQSLDGLRGIAILLVLFRHTAREFRQEPSRIPIWNLGGWDAATPLLNGWIGVDLFFVLSGFLIGYHYLKRRHELSVGRYLVKRILRIIPVYYTLIILLFFNLIPFYSVKPRENLQSFISHFFFLQDYFGSDLVVAFWSLGVEEKFYLSIPFLIIPILWIGSLSGRLVYLLCLSLIPFFLRTYVFLSSQGEMSYPIYFQIFRSPFHMTFDGLIVGTTIAFVFHHQKNSRFFKSPILHQCLIWGGISLISFLLVATIHTAFISWFDCLILPLILAVGFGAILLGSLFANSWWTRIMSNPLLFFFSKLSYSLYCVHMMLLKPTQTILSSWSFYTESSLGLKIIIYFPVFLVLSLVASLCLYYVVEKPFLIIKDRM